jgi:hypothetical protein
MTDTATGKNYIATKVFDKDCDICKHMSKHDRVLFEEFPEIAYQELLLDDIINHENNLTKLRIYQVLERHALNADYTIDLPVYILLSRKGQYKGHHVGVATIVELRDKIKECLEDTPE